MTPHATLSLLTQEQTVELVTAACAYLDVPRLEAALRSGLEERERRLLAFQLSVEFDTQES